MAEMFPRPTDYIQPQKSSAWLEKAKQLAAVGEKKVEAFTFQPESCVKLNNVEAARRLLDQMYAQMQADKKTEILQQAPPVPEKVERSDRFLFTVKICIAEGLIPLDTSPSSRLDTFVTLSDEQGHRLAKTRTIYETLNPRCTPVIHLCMCLCSVASPYPPGDETFDISVEKALWLMVSVRDRALVGKHDSVGRAYICLDPRRYGDFLTHDQWMDLDSQGRILLRISMEGEKDDLQFYFGRAFRSLKRAEADMVRVFIDKVSPGYARASPIPLTSRNAGVAIHPAMSLPAGAEDAREDERGEHRLQQGAGERDGAVRVRAGAEQRGGDDPAAAEREAAHPAGGALGRGDRAGDRAAVRLPRRDPANVQHLPERVNEGDGHDARVEGDPERHRRPAHPPAVGHLERHEAAHGQGGRHRVQVAQGASRACLCMCGTLTLRAVPARLLLRGRRRACAARGAPEPEVPRCPVDPALLRLAHVRPLPSLPARAH